MIRDSVCQEDITIQTFLIANKMASKYKTKKIEKLQGA